MEKLAACHELGRSFCFAARKGCSKQEHKKKRSEATFYIARVDKSRDELVLTEKVNEAINK